MTDAYLKELASTENMIVPSEGNLPKVHEGAGADLEQTSSLETAESSVDTKITFREKKRLLWHGKTCMSFSFNLSAVAEAFIRFGTSHDCR